MRFLRHLRGFPRLLLFVGVVSAVVFFARGQGAPVASPAPAPTATSTTTARAPSPTATAGDDALPTEAPDREWLTDVEEFITVYTSAGTVPAPAWRDRVSALTTPELGAGLRMADPANIPTGKIVASRAVTDYADGGGIVRIRLDSGPVLLVTVIYDAQGDPLVANVEPQR